MSTAWEIFQERIKAKMRKQFSDGVVEHSFDPQNVGNISGANGHARVTGPCGDVMEIWLKIEGDTIVDAGFLTNGCGSTVASGSMITEMVKGKTAHDAREIGQQDVLEALGGLPEEYEHCALLASDTLKAAILDHTQAKDRLKK